MLDYKDGYFPSFFSTIKWSTLIIIFIILMFLFILCNHCRFNGGMGSICF